MDVQTFVMTEAAAGNYICQVCWAQRRERVVLVREGPGIYRCPQCGTELLTSTPAETERADRGPLVYMGFIPGTRKGGGSSHSRQASPQRQKQDARLRQELPGARIRAAAVVMVRMKRRTPN